MCKGESKRRRDGGKEREREDVKMENERAKEDVRIKGRGQK